jgi:O-methyltransferase domain
MTREAATRLGERLTIEGGNFFERVPQADLYCLRTILHDWRDPACLTILRQYRSASQAEARLVVIEQLLGEDTPSAPIARLDLTRMVQLGGRERTQKEYDHLLRGANRRRTCPFP